MSRLNVANFRHPDGTADNINLDSSGRLLVGTTSAFSSVRNAYESEATPTRQTYVATATNSVNNGFGIYNFSSSGYAPNLDLCASKNNTVGSHTIVSSDQALGHINFGGSDGTQFRVGATILAAADGTPGASDMPGKLVFSTTADGASSPTEQMRLTSTGDLRFNSGYGSVATAYGVRAWVNFNGRNTLSIYDDGGISSITDNGTGDYTVNFDFTMPDINYAFTGSASYVGAASSAIHTVELRGNTARSTSKTTTAIRHDVVYSDGSQNRTRFDYDEISIVYFR